MAEALRVLGYRAGHLDMIRARADFIAERAVSDGSEGEYGGPFTFTMMRGAGEYVACGGVLMLADQPGNVGLWGYAADLTPREWAAVARQIRATLEAVASRHFVKAVAWARLENEKALSFLAHLGFRPIGLWRDDSGLEFVTMTRSLV
jgi:hypothetical protein